MAILIQKYKDEEMGRWEIGDQPVIFGRAVDATVFIEDPAVSRQHAQVERSGDSYTITDLDSHNGTFVNGKQIVQARLKNGDEIVIGKYHILFMDDSPAVKEASDMMLLKEESKHAAKLDEKSWFLSVTAKNFEQTTFLQKSDYLVGKSNDCDIILTGWKVSAVHAMLVKDSGGIKLINVSDKKPVLLNGKPAPKKITISPNDEIGIGGYTLKIFTKE